jgi:hypothetical protein
MRTAASARWFAWAGLVAGPAAWALHHQLGSNLNFYDCSRAGGPWLVVTGLALTAIAVAGGGLSMLAWRRTQADPTRRFIGLLGAMSGGLFALTLLIQTFAAVVLPPCFR